MSEEDIERLAAAKQFQGQQEAFGKLHLSYWKKQFSEPYFFQSQLCDGTGLSAGSHHQQD